MSETYFELDDMASKLFSEFHKAIDGLRADDTEAKKYLYGAFITLQEDMYCLEARLAPASHSREHQRCIAAEARNGMLAHSDKKD